MTGPIEALQPPAPWTIGPISRTDIVRYQGASGDMNPLHHDDAYAAAAGYPTVISVGMLQAGFLASFASDWLGAENVRRFRVRFKSEVFPGDVLVCSGSVRSQHTDEAGNRQVEVELLCRRGEDTVLEGDALYELRGEPT